MELDEHQSRAFDHIRTWHELALRRRAPLRLCLGGHAGTGKTTLVRALVGHFGRSAVAVCAYTGKAASVLRQKSVSASTIHRLIYQPETTCDICHAIVDAEGYCNKCDQDALKTTRFVRVQLLGVSLIIVDEASMLTERLVTDLESFEIPVLYVGDHGQLEPIGEDPAIMQTPDLVLEQVHRQAEGSAIIRFAHMLRRGDQPLCWTGGGDVHVRIGMNRASLLDYDAILCGYNSTRCQINAHVRALRGFSGPPAVGERLLCFQNDSDLGIYNGMLVTVTGVRGESNDAFVLDLEDDVGERFAKIPVLTSRFGTERPRPDGYVRGVGIFDFGYAMTVHKAQGSEWRRVAVLEQIHAGWTPSRWRYTAATRASETLDYCLPRGRPSMAR